MKLLTHTDRVTNDKGYRLTSRIAQRMAYFEKMYTATVTEAGAFDNKRSLGKLNFFLSHGNWLISRLRSVGFKYINYQVLGYEDSESAKINPDTRDSVYLSVLHEVDSWPDRKSHFESMFWLLNELIEFDDDLSSHLLQQMSQSAKNGAIQRLSDRLWIQLNEAYAKHWFIIFSTLTVDSRHLDKVFTVGSDCWRNYIRRINRYFGKCRYGSWREAEKQPNSYMHYFGVTERGGENERLHIHCLSFVDLYNPDAPGNFPFSDPNSGRLERDQREIHEMQRFWPYGLSSHIAVRWSDGDSWGRRGWLWPMIDGTPMPGSSIEQLNAYLLKYITKAENIEATKEAETWKIKANHLMGREALLNKLETLTHKQIRSLIPFKVYPMAIQLFGKKINSKLIRALAVKIYLKKNRSLVDQNTSLKSTTIEKLLRAMTGKKQCRNYANIGELLSQLYENGDTSSRSLENFLSAKRSIEKSFPENNFRTPSSANLRRAN